MMISYILRHYVEGDIELIIVKENWWTTSIPAFQRKHPNNSNIPFLNKKQFINCFNINFDSLKFIGGLCGPKAMFIKEDWHLDILPN